MANLIPVQAGSKGERTFNYDFFFGPLSCFANEMAYTGHGGFPISEGRPMPTWGIVPRTPSKHSQPEYEDAIRQLANQLAKDGGAYKPEGLEKLPEYKLLIERMDDLENIFKGLADYTTESFGGIYKDRAYQTLNEKPDSFDTLLNLLKQYQPETVKKPRERATTTNAKKPRKREAKSKAETEATNINIGLYCSSNRYSTELESGVWVPDGSAPGGYSFKEL